jgi:hypothetical protein
VGNKGAVGEDEESLINTKVLETGTPAPSRGPVAWDMNHKCESCSFLSPYLFTGKEALTCPYSSQTKVW